MPASHRCLFSASPCQGHHHKAAEPAFQRSVIPKSSSMLEGTMVPLAPPDPFFPKASYDTSQRWGHVAVLNTGPSCKGPASPQAFTPLPAPARSQNCPVQPQTLPKSLSATSRSTGIYLPIHLQHTPSTQHSNPATLGCLSATQHRGKGLVTGNFTFSSQIMVQMQATAGHLGLQGNFCVPCSLTTKLRHQERRKTVADGEGCKATAPKPAFRPFCQLQNNLHPYQSS